MAGFAALAACFGCALPVVGKVAAAGLSALAARFRGAFRVIGEVAAAGLTTLAARFGCQLGVLREAALLRGYALTALAGDFTLLVFVHGSEAAIGRATIFILGHLRSPYWIGAGSTDAAMNEGEPRAVPEFQAGCIRRIRLEPL